MQDVMKSATEQAKKAYEDMKRVADRRRRPVTFMEGAHVRMSTRNLSFRDIPAKLRKRFVGPFKVLERIGTNAYRLELPSKWRIHDVFHVSLLQPWYTGSFVHGGTPYIPDLEEDAPEDLDMDVSDQSYTVDKLLRWRWVQKGRTRRREYLVLWQGYPLDEATWEPASHFDDAGFLRTLIERDSPSEVVS